MEVDVFTERLARIRQRFAATLDGKIDDSFDALPALTSNDAAAIEALMVTHRKLHEMCGIAPSLGFAGTGKAAREAESVLREPAKSKRSLTAAEIASLTEKLDALRAAAHADLQSDPA